jgi:hypothetical protein
MTQLRSNPAAISNYFDDLIRGIGKRGSTFTDIDAVTHDLDTKRFLFQEFKHEGEALCTAQRWVLNDLADLPRCTVWVARVLDTTPLTSIELEIVGHGTRIVTEHGYRCLFAHWWTNPSCVPARPWEGLVWHARHLPLHIFRTGTRFASGGGVAS